MYFTNLLEFNPIYSQICQWIVTLNEKIYFIYYYFTETKYCLKHNTLKGIKGAKNVVIYLVFLIEAEDII